MATFDASAYKQTTREQWQRAAEPWHVWGATIESWLGEATDLMLDLAGIERGARVLDVAAGAGGQTLRAAERVGPDGVVLATDIAPAILAYAERAAREAGHANVVMREMDGEELDVDPGIYDAVISRVGLIYLPDRAARSRASTARCGPEVASHRQLLDARSQRVLLDPGVRDPAPRRPPAPAPGQPGPFSLGSDGAIEAAYASAGFRDIEVRKVAAPLRLPTAADCLRFEQESFGALHQMLAGLDESARARPGTRSRPSCGASRAPGASPGRAR